MACMGHCEIKPPVYEKFTEKKKSVHTNKLENGLTSLYGAFQFDVINASTIYTNINQELNVALLHVKSMFTFL